MGQDRTQGSAMEAVVIAADPVRLKPMTSALNAAPVMMHELEKAVLRFFIFCPLPLCAGHEIFNEYLPLFEKLASTCKVR
jgi:hypothetical protein